MFRTGEERLQRSYVDISVIKDRLQIRFDCKQEVFSVSLNSLFLPLLLSFCTIMKPVTFMRPQSIFRGEVLRNSWSKSFSNCLYMDICNTCNIKLEVTIQKKKLWQSGEVVVFFSLMNFENSIHTYNLKLSNCIPDSFNKKKRYNCNFCQYNLPSFRKKSKLWKRGILSISSYASPTTEQ